MRAIQRRSPQRTWPERLAVPFTGVSAGAFAALSALRRNRVFHPVGEAYVGTIDIRPPDNLSLPEGNHRAIVRFSRGAGVPEPLPDVLGLAIKIPSETRAEEQDLLLASSGVRSVTRNLLIPSRSFLKCSYSSVLPYDAGSRQVLFGARAEVKASSASGVFGDLEDLVARGRLRFSLLLSGLTGPWSEIGSLEVEEKCPQEISRELRFNPWNTQIRPAGPLNTLRKSTYPASQEARPD